MKSPLTGYYGGKGRMREFLLGVFADAPWKRYIEPFCGGGAVFFTAWERWGAARTYIINDRMDCVVNFYRVAQSQPDALIKMARERLVFSDSQSRMARAIIRSNGGHSDLEKAWAMWYSICTSFAGVVGGTMRRPTTRLHCNECDTLLQRFAALEKCANALQNTIIEQMDGVELITRYDQPGVMFFVDPPYVGFHQAHYAGYEQSDFDSLLAALRAIKGQFVMTTYENTALAAAVAECGWHTLTYETHCATDKKESARTEIITTNIPQIDEGLV